MVSKGVVAEDRSRIEAGRLASVFASGLVGSPWGGDDALTGAEESKEPRRTLETMQGDRLQVQSTRKRLYLIGVAESLMAVLCRSRVCMSKWRGWKGREEKGTVVATSSGSQKRAGLHTASGCEPTHTNH